MYKKKENNLKFKKNNTAKSNFKNINKNLRQNLFNMGKTIKKENKSKKNIKGEKINKEKNVITSNRFNSPQLIRENITQMTPVEPLTNKNINKKILYKELLIQKTKNNLPNMTKSKTNTDLIYNFNNNNIINYNSTKIKKKTLLYSKSNGNINTVTKQLFSPSNMEILKIIKTDKIKFLNNENLIYNSINNDNNNICFNTLPNNTINTNNINDLNQQTISPLRKEKDNLILNRISLKSNKKNNIPPIKVNLNSKCFNESSSNNKHFFNNKKTNIINSESLYINKALFSNSKIFTKEKKNLKKNSIKNKKILK